MESQADYRLAPPLLRPLTDAEHRETKDLTDALTQAKIALGDRHAELRMMLVAVEELTKRALKAEAQEKRLYPLVRYVRGELHEAKLISDREYAELSAVGGSYALDTYDELRARTEKAEARVKEQQAELAEQERDKLRLIQETHNWSAAVKKLEAERAAR